MLLTRPVLDGILAKDITLVFRRWTKPTVKTGGRLRTVIGELAIGAVDVVDRESITDAEARGAGYESAAALLDDLFKERPATSRGRVVRSDGERHIYRVAVAYSGQDTRIALRTDEALSAEGLAKIRARLDGFDARSSFGPWTRSALQLINDWPGRRAPELAEIQGRETMPFKNDVRKLKEMGLTESLTVGYRLSPRGIRVLEALHSS
jgi:hypothetical protein